MATIEEQTMEKEMSSRMRNLHNDIIIEILSWVPANSLLRWRCVCKYWFHLIKNPSFVQKHLHHSTTGHEPSLLISTPYRNVFGKLDLQCYLNYTTGSFSNSKLRISHPFKSCSPIMDLTTSVNGLLFCYKYDQKRFCIWNPCTKEYIVLPDPPFIKFDRHHERTVCQYGFGYNQTINDYKVVVRNEYKDNCLPSEVQVYTLGTNSWRKIRPIPKDELRTRQHCGVFMNGAVHWLDSSGEKIISFDFGKEKYKEVSIKQGKPKCSHGIWVHTMGIQALEGSLCCLVTLAIDHPAAENYCLEMWVMSDYDVNNENSWTMLFSSMPSDYLSLSFIGLKPLKLNKNGEILMLKWFNELVLCDPKSKTIRTLTRIREEHHHFEAVYIESLVSLNSGTYYAAPDGQKERRINEDEIEIVKNISMALLGIR